MSINKNALIRYQVLDKCFRNAGRMYFIEDLLELCNHALIEFDPNCKGIKKRQLYDDIRFMESESGWLIPLGKYKYERKIYYRYEDLSFSINNQILNDTETEKIKSALYIFSKFSGSPEFEWINEIIPLLETKFGIIKGGKHVIEYETNIDLKGHHFISPLFNAIINERVLSIKYKDFKTKEPYEIEFHPYYLKQYNNRWFVFGLNPENQIPTWNLAIDRIESITESSKKIIKNDIDWDSYFFDIIGVTRAEDGILQEIVLSFSNNLAPYIITKPLHASQKHKFNSDRLEVRIKVIPNYELEKLILSFGNEVKVISPESIKNNISTKLKSASDQYLEN